MSCKRLMVIGAHPDDPELMAGGTALKLIAGGGEVMFVSCTDGSAGHQVMKRRELATRRRQEALASARLLGLASYEVLDIPDGELMPTLDNRQCLVRLIRNFAPDIVVTHRLCDYHPDHRATAQLVQDASFLLIVPLVCPDVPALKTQPVVMFSWDNFRKPTPFSPSVAVEIDSVIAQKLESLDCHVSQFYEFLAYLRNRHDSLPEDREGRFAWLNEQWLCRNRLQNERFSELIERQYGVDRANIRHVESFELSEYGRQPADDELWKLFPLASGGSLDGEATRIN